MATDVRTNGETQSVKQTAQQIASQAKDKAQDATERLGGMINEQVDTRSTQAADQVSNVANAIRQAGQSASEQTPAAGRMADAAADRLDLLGGYLQNTSGEQIVNDVQDFARRQPWVVAGAAAFLGVVTARFLKAANEGTTQQPTSTAAVAPVSSTPPATPSRANRSGSRTTTA